MIYCLTGKILKKTPDTVVIRCGGVGYLASVPSSVSGALPGVGSEGTLYTYMNITENDVSLFGFESEEQRSCFEMLIGVSGVGPKVGIAILNVLSPSRIALAIAGGDHKSFTAANGVGPKLAQRIVLELKDKVGKGLASEFAAADIAAPAPAAGGSAQAVAALVSLGYSSAEAASAVAKCDPTLPVEEIVRLALRSMATGR